MANEHDPQQQQHAVGDAFGRALGNLRLSVTDRCNIRCAYCMPEEQYHWLPRSDILQFEELNRIVDAFTGLGVRKVRLTGGEPLLRKDLPVLVAMLAAKPELEDLAITTNGVLLAEQAAALRAAGLHRVTVSLDTLRPERFRELTRRDQLPRVLEGIAAAHREFGGLKLDTVVLRGVNADELCDLIEFGRGLGAEVRFIEYMDVGGASGWSMQRVVPRRELLAAVAARYGAVQPLAGRGAAPAERFALPDGTTFGVIASTTAPFCGACDRSRVTADGMWYLCLYARTGIDLRRPLREGASLAEMQAVIREGWRQRTDRGAEQRLALADRRAQRGSGDPHLEMHTRGG